MRSNETEQKIAEVRGALAQMRWAMPFRRKYYTNHLQPHRQCVPSFSCCGQGDGLPPWSVASKKRILSLTPVSAEVEERRKPGSTLGKRKASCSPPGEDDEESGLQSAVKKLIRQAQLESDSPNHSSGPASATSASPRTSGNVDMRIFSDTPRDRPVFGAYPLPQQPTQAIRPLPPQLPATAPFTWPIATTSATNYPAFPTQNAFTPLDPAVEAMLASYFPTTGQPQQQGMAGSGPVAIPQVPDDFLSRVFNFGWDGGQAGGMGSVQAGGHGQGLGDEVGSDMQGYVGWGSHGWMA